ncbi:hypothetical protein GQE99_07115 [Maritimibacter sp. DP07]|uniref:Thioesterase domain-containing protein n=1 Tax=Maritimibacter harenae TaxID=2606218 RepID=A0A845M352_9RHOB|nr:hypothetical protein [Maritimibacter harenae]MZR12788.1 hypothetical protein [Maritimibacter harenae]
MNAPQPVVDLSANLARVGRLTRRWSGEALDPEGCLRFVKGDPEALPIYFCSVGEPIFNGLIEALGGRCDLVGMRSLRWILPDSEINGPVAEFMADHYARHLHRAFGDRPCIVGGNCAASGLAYRVAAKLVELGVPVERLVALEAEYRFPFPGHVRHIYGIGGENYNPFEWADGGALENILARWSHAYGSVDWIEIEGEHGEFSRPENAPALAEAILRPVEPGSAALSTPKPSAPLDLRWSMTVIRPDHVILDAYGPADRTGLAMLPVWRTSDGRLARVNDDGWLRIAPQTGAWTCRVTRPDRPGPWTLHPVLCRAGEGPVQWPVAEIPGFEVD